MVVCALGALPGAWAGPGFKGIIVSLLTIDGQQWNRSCVAIVLQLLTMTDDIVNCRTSSFIHRPITDESALRASCQSGLRLGISKLVGLELADNHVCPSALVTECA